MKAALISLGSISSRWIVDELKKKFDTVDAIDVTELEVRLGERGDAILYKGKPLPSYDCIYARGSFRYATLLRAISALRSKESYMPLRPASFTIGHDKVLSHLKFQENNIPQPKTHLVATVEGGKHLIKEASFPIIMKMPSGTHGKGVMLADSQESASSLIDTLALLKQPFLIQEYIDTDGVDYRCIVVGEEVVASMKRTAGKGEKRANIHSGGKGEKIILDEKIKKVAIAAARACGLDICAVDILPSLKGPLVLEVNLSPGLQGITGVTGINVAEKIAKYLFEQTEAFKGIRKEEMLKQLQPEQEIHGALDFRGNRILLPEVVTMASKIREDDEVILKAKKGKVEIEKVGKREKVKE
ncbi:RimK family alpha-L-glutamate ligase [Candidatus Woesearchaeota archaeon]|nr:RimK family alpha-L-glutamate ligase [Candidatus Woesearchaeota archaeon]